VGLDIFIFNKINLIRTIYAKDKIIIIYIFVLSIHSYSWSKL